MMSERSTVRHGRLPDGRLLSWTVIDVLDGRGDVFSSRRELFTVNYEQLTIKAGELLLKELDAYEVR